MSMYKQTGIQQRFRNFKSNPQDHWLDHAEDKCGAKLVLDTKKVLNVLVMYIPLPMAWALHTQQESRWVFQAAKLNGDIGFYTIKPDQIMLFNSIFAIVLIPLFENYLFPLFSKIGIKNPLQKMAVGGFLTGVAFVISGLLELQAQTSYISILWMIPQYLCMVSAEILLYTANLNFAYTQAPSSMKSVMMAVMHLTVAVGSLFVIFISGFALFKSQAFEFFFFAGILFLDMILFVILAIRYKYVEQEVKVLD